MRLRHKSQRYSRNLNQPLSFWECQCNISSVFWSKLRPEQTASSTNCVRRRVGQICPRAKYVRANCVRTRMGHICPMMKFSRDLSDFTEIVLIIGCCSNFQCFMIFCILLLCCISFLFFFVFYFHFGTYMTLTLNWEREREELIMNWDR